MVYVFPPCHLALGTELPAERAWPGPHWVWSQKGELSQAGPEVGVGGAPGGGGQAPDPRAAAGPPATVGPSAALPRCDRPCRLSGEDMGGGAPCSERLHGQMGPPRSLTKSNFPGHGTGQSGGGLEEARDKSEGSVAWDGRDSRFHQRRFLFNKSNLLTSRGVSCQVLEGVKMTPVIRW